ncbi:hypothetical protein ROS1_60650 [Roseibium sp. ROS1]
MTAAPATPDEVLADRTYAMETHNRNKFSKVLYNKLVVTLGISGWWGREILTITFLKYAKVRKLL